MRRIAAKWACIALATGGLAGAMALVGGVTAPGKPRAPRFALAYSTTCGATDTGFCISGPPAGQGPALYPGVSDQPVKLGFTNYFGSPIAITQITVTFTNPFPAGCDATTFEVNDRPIDGSSKAVTIGLPPGFTVGAASGSTPTSAEYDDMLTVSMADLKTRNQDPCEGIALAMSYSATASSQVSCLAKKANGSLTIPSGEDFCIAAGGTQNGNVTVQGGGRLDLLGGAVNGGITVQGGGLNVQGGSVNGSVAATGANLFSICGASFNGNLSATSLSAFALIGDGGDDGAPACAGNTIKGGVSLTGNSAGAELGGNTISGSVTVTGTTGAPYGVEAGTAAEIERNVITGSLSCSANNPAPVDDAVAVGGANSVGGGRSGQCATPAGF